MAKIPVLSEYNYDHDWVDEINNIVLTISFRENTISKPTKNTSIFKI